MTEPARKEPPRYEPQPSILGALVRNLMSLFFVGVAVMCVYNVFGVGGEVEVMAKETACQGHPMPCTAQYTRAERTPWAHTYKMHTSSTLGAPISGEMDISCQRQYIFVGDYSCKSKSGATVGVDPASSASPGNAPSVGVAPSSSALVRFPPKAKIPVPTRPAASSTSTGAPAAPVAPAASP